MRKSWNIRKDAKAVSPVIATILMVAITVVLAAVLYVMVTGLLAGPGTARPTVGFNVPEIGATQVIVSVGDATPQQALTNFAAVVLVNGTEVARMDNVGGAADPPLSFVDLDGGGRLTGGDRFIIAQVTDGDYELILFYQGSQVSRAIWSI